MHESVHGAAHPSRLCEKCYHIRSIGGATYRAYLDAGYREYFIQSSLHGTPYLLQKACYDSAGVRCFFIDVEVWNFYDHRPENPVAYQPWVQYNSDDSQTFRVTLWPDEMTPQAIEDFFWNVYYKLGASPHGND